MLRILISPLDWGLGHTSRCIPLIQNLQKLGATIFVACNASQQNYLQSEVVNVQYISLKGYNIRYAKSKYQLIAKLIVQIPKIINTIFYEHKALKKIITDYAIDAVISDNRYGFYSNKITSIFITHQLMIRTPFAKTVVNYLNHFFIGKFHACWIPDVEGSLNLSGSLSHVQKQLSFKTHFIGVLSRMKFYEKVNALNPNSILLILSGIEPQKSILKNSIVSQVKNSSYTLSIVGDANNTINYTMDNISYYSIVDTKQLQNLIAKHACIISRSGYSTAMDLAMLGRSAIMIATPGQSEQEYLAQYYHAQKMHIACVQNNFDLKEAIIDLQKLPDAVVFNNTELKGFLKKWLEKLRGEKGWS